ncbi:hypothetical protein CMEL01_01448 [Colletotrichum melonis]|uniref:Uncharacterized protein n=1 Tax=Colletotrichum melonis TaxID=1209925 RepID=A0AAI9V333_9PEZI|nr:hypothetical protein CMEL01_01448 [Colletotrichum melonis]
MQANEEPPQAMSPDAQLQQRVPMVSSNQYSPESTHEWTMSSTEAEIMASEISSVSPHANYGINLDIHQHEDLSISDEGTRKTPISVTTYTSAQQTSQGPDEGPQPTNASAERLDEIKRATETLKPTWKIWAVEISCIALSTLFLTVIIVVLFRYDSQELRHWPLGTTLNSFLALFTALAKAAFMIPVCACISQSQWAWYANGTPKPLYDFELIDQASRVAWGSLVLLWRFRFQHFVVLGALLTTISALTSPFTQLSINYSLKDIPVEKEASESQATTPAVRDLMYPRDDLVSAIRFAGQRAPLLDYEGFQKPLPYSAIDTNATFCSTSNCTFDQYQSLGICVKMANITSSLKVEKFEGGRMTETPTLSDRFLPNSSVWKVALPNGFEFNHQSKAALFTDIMNGSHTLAFRNSPALLSAKIASFFLIYTTPILKNDEAWWSSEDKSPNNTWQEVLDHVHSVEREALEVLFHLPSRWNEVLRLKSPTRNMSLSVKPAQDEVEPFSRRKLCLENIYQNAATLLSAALRMKRPYNQKVRGVFMVPGHVTTMATFVKITWPWVMLLAAEIAAAAIFLVVTIMYSTGGSDSKYRDLKSSSLSTLVALGPDCHTAAGGGLQPVDDLQKLAKRLQVQIRGS